MNQNQQPQQPTFEQALLNVHNMITGISQHIRDSGQALSLMSSEIKKLGDENKKLKAEIDKKNEKLNRKAKTAKGKTKKKIDRM